VVFLHGTTWDTKHWPEAYWRELAERMGRAQVKLPWGNPAEKARAERIAQGLNNCQVLPKLNLAGVARVLAARKAAWRSTPAWATWPLRWMCRPFRCSARPTRPDRRLRTPRFTRPATSLAPRACRRSAPTNRRRRPAPVRSQTRVAAVLHSPESRACSEPLSALLLAEDALMQLAFVLYKYFPFGGLQRDFMRIALECQKRGHQIRVYTLIWEGDIPPGFEVLVAPVKAFFNHRRNEKLSAWMAADLAKRPVDRLIGFNKMPGLDVYYAADGCFEDKAQTLRGGLYRRWGRYRHFAEYERAVFAKDAHTEVLMISEVQQPLFIKHYDTPRSASTCCRRASPRTAAARPMPTPSAPTSAKNSAWPTTTCCWCRSVRASRPRAWTAASRPWPHCLRPCANAPG
jgi:hypothetical protein